MQGQASVEQQNHTLQDIANNMRPIYPTITVVNGSLNNNVNGVQLIEQANSSNSSYSFQDKVGYLRSESKNGLAQIIMYGGTTNDGQDIVAITLVNTDTTKFYIKSLGIDGETSTGMVPLEDSVLDSDYSAQVYNTIPAPTITKLVVLYPNQSISAYMKGGPWVEPYTNQPITDFTAGSSFFFDKGDPNYNNGTLWSIGVKSNTLNFGGFSNSTS